MHIMISMSNGEKFCAEYDCDNMRDVRRSVVQSRELNLFIRAEMTDDPSNSTYFLNPNQIVSFREILNWEYYAVRSDTE